MMMESSIDQTGGTDNLHLVSQHIHDPEKTKEITERFSSLNLDEEVFLILTDTLLQSTLDSEAEEVRREGKHGMASAGEGRVPSRDKSRGVPVEPNETVDMFSGDPIKTTLSPNAISIMTPRTHKDNQLVSSKGVKEGVIQESLGCKEQVKKES